MKFTVNDADKKANAVVEAQAEIESVKKKSAAEKAELENQAEAAADAGNVDRYMQLKQQAERVDATAYVRVKQLEKVTGPTNEEISAAWNDYAAGYSKSLSAGLARLEKAKEALLAEYAALIDLQETALKTRARLAGYSEGLKEEQLVMDYIPFKKTTVTGAEEGAIVPIFGNDPYCAMFLAENVKSLKYQDLNRDLAYNRVYNVVYNRKTT